MAVLEVYGASDDLIEFSGEGCKFPDEGQSRAWAEYGLYLDSKPGTREGDGYGPLYQVAQFRVASDASGDAVTILGMYTNDGVWTFTVAQCGEDTPIPADWDIRLTQSRETLHSAQLTIKAPYTLTVRAIK